MNSRQLARYFQAARRDRTRQNFREYFRCPNGTQVLCEDLPPQGLDANVDLGIFNAGTSLIIRIDCPAGTVPGDARQLGVPIESLRLVSGVESRPLPSGERSSFGGVPILG